MAVTPNQPLTAYAHDHEHRCPVCEGLILACGPVRPEDRPESRLDEYMRPSTPSHEERIRAAMVEHRCGTAGERIRYERFLMLSGKVAQR